MTRVLLLLSVFAVVLVTVYASCPNNDCNNHGTCNQKTSECTCNIGWAGVGCEHPVKELVPFRPLRSESVPIRQWMYYYTNTVVDKGSTNRYIWKVNTTGNVGDLDLFIQQGHIPSRTDYIKRNITLAPNFSLEVDISKDATYYAGVYAFSGPATPSAIGYSIELITETFCPSNCNNRGNCVGGVCNCTLPFTGAACDVAIPSLSLGKPVADSVRAGSWKYYLVNAVTENALRVIVNQTSANSDVDLYIRYKKVPTLTHYDLAEMSLAPNFYLDIQLSPSTFGLYVLGVYGVSDCAYLIQYVQYNDCPNQCSGHGTCAGTGCSCSPGYSGALCETKTAALRDGEEARGLVSDSSWNWYTFLPRSTTDLLFTLTQIGGPGQDCDLYVKRLKNPSLTSYDARNITLAPVATIRINQPALVTWHIGVFGFTYCQYSIKVVSTNQCAKCVHGQCDSAEGVCQCNPGWAGELCDTAIIPITNFTQPLVGSTQANKWSYYSIKGTVGRLIRVSLLELESTGALWLYMLEKTPPTPTYYNPHLADTRTNTNVHQLFTYTTNNETWYIGVYGSPFSTDPNKAFTYKLEAWESPF